MKGDVGGAKKTKPRAAMCSLRALGRLLCLRVGAYVRVDSRRALCVLAGI